MRFGYSELCLAHDPGPRHPESPDRIRAVRRGLARKHGVEYVEADPAPLDLIERVHEAAYVADIQEFCEAGGGNWDPDTVATPETWAAARMSAGLAGWTAVTALDGDDGRDTPFSIGRPPGHHATEDDAMGFCFLNNAAVGAARALDEGADRVAIVDWDVHHGNGTQDIFYDRGDVFYASVHEDGLYPGTGAADEVGEDDGLGATLNVPLPAGAGDTEYGLVFQELFVPAIEAFDPDLLLVSAGFDAHRHDPISRMHVSTEGFGALADTLRDAAGRTDAALGFVLEGGYSLDALSEGVGMIHEVFDGREPHVEPGAPSGEVADLVTEIGEDRADFDLG